MLRSNSYGLGAPANQRLDFGDDPRPRPRMVYLTGPLELNWDAHTARHTTVIVLKGGFDGSAHPDDIPMGR